MSSPTIWYYGDQTVTGGYTQNQQLSVLGSGTFNNFTGPTLGSSGSQFKSFYTSNANVSVLNVQSLSFISQVPGNVNVTNAISVFQLSANSMNVTTLSVQTIPGNIGFGTTDNSSTLYVGGNLYSSVSVGGQNVFTPNMNGFYTTTTSLVQVQSTLVTNGNAIVSNSVSVNNVFVTTGSVNNIKTANIFSSNIVSNINCLTVNTSSLFANTFSIGTNDRFTSLNVFGNVQVSNSVQVNNVFSKQVFVSGTSNIGQIFSRTMGPLGNIVVSNSVTTTNIFANSLTVFQCNGVSLISTYLLSSFTFTFTTMGATGAFGPTVVTYSQTPPGWSGLYGGIQYWTVPNSGIYNFVIAGAGSPAVQTFSGDFLAGSGFVLTASYFLTAGTLLAILVGQMGIVSTSAAGGSGGSFVAIVNGTDSASLLTAVPLFVAGGASGVGIGNNQNVNANNTTSGNSGGIGPPRFSGLGGTGGYGGGTATNSGYSAAGGGAGFWGNGAVSLNGSPSNPPAQSFINGGQGETNFTGKGGFGGGAASLGLGDGAGRSIGAGGGGYSGGGAGGTGSTGTGGGGGGSYDITGMYSGSAKNSGLPGYVIISFPVVISGNAYSSNSLTTPTLNVASVNVTSVNVTSIQGSPGYFVSGLSSSSVTATTIVANTIYSGTTITMLAPHLTPNATNGPLIQGWISATCNASSQPTRSWWSTSLSPSFSNVLITTPGGYQGGVLLPDGRVLFVPSTASNPCFYNPKTLQFSVSGTSVTPGNFGNGLLLPSGNVVFCPQNSNVGMFNPVSGKFSNGAALSGGTYSGTLTANNVVFAPQGVPSNIVNWNYSTGAATNVYALSGSTYPVNFIMRAQVGSNDFFSIAWSPQLGIFAAGCNGNFTWSTDGKNWAPLSTLGSVIWQGIAWSPQLGLFAACGGSGNFTWSTDGKTWAPPSTPQGAVNFYSIAWSPQLGLFAACGGSGNFTWSTDGKTWPALSVLGSCNWTSIAWSPQLGLFAACGSIIGGSTGYFTWSTDGKIWAPLNTMLVAAVQSLSWSPQLGIFVACGLEKFVTSTDGKLWTISFSIGTNFTSVTWSPQLGLFVIFGTFSGNGYFTWSTDGKNFPPRVLTSVIVQASTWSPQLGIFVAGGNGGKFTSSEPSFPLQTGACLLPNGNVIVPYPGTANVIQFNPVNLTSSNIFVGTSGFNGLVLAPNGNVIGVPQNSNILVINPSTFTSSNVNNPSQTFYNGGCLLPSGNIVFTPSLASNVGLFDPSTFGFSNFTPTGNSFSGATLIPNGQVIFSPQSNQIGIYDSLTPVSTEFCLSPYFNKF